MTKANSCFKGAANFGSPFRVPGLVTVGPNFRIIAQISGDAVMEFETSYKLDVVGWDYSQRYPTLGIAANTDSVDAEEAPNEPGFTVPKSNPTKYNLDASGEIITPIIPKKTLGVTFDSDIVANAEIVLGVEVWALLYGTLEFGSSKQLNICYGANSQVKLFAQIIAPNLIGFNPNRRTPLQRWPDQPFEILKYSCTNPPQKRDFSPFIEDPKFGLNSGYS